MAECLPSICEALGSIPCSEKDKKACPVQTSQNQRQGPLAFLFLKTLTVFQTDALSSVCKGIGQVTMTGDRVMEDFESQSPA